MIERYETDEQGNRLHFIDGELRATVAPENFDSYLADRDLGGLDVDLGLKESKAGELDPDTIVYYMPAPAAVKE